MDRAGHRHRYEPTIEILRREPARNGTRPFALDAAALSGQRIREPQREISNAALPSGRHPVLWHQPAPTTADKGPCL